MCEGRLARASKMFGCNYVLFISLERTVAALMGRQGDELRTSCAPKRLGEELLRWNMISCPPATQSKAAQIAGPRFPRCRHLTHPSALTYGVWPPAPPRLEIVSTVGDMSASWPSVRVR